MSLCLSVLEPHLQTLPSFLGIAIARSFSGSVAITLCTSALAGRHRFDNIRRVSSGQTDEHMERDRSIYRSSIMSPTVKAEFVEKSVITSRKLIIPSKLELLLLISLKNIQKYC